MNEAIFATDLKGHDASKAAFLSAHHSGRLHHAWLLTGPRGIGKASFAWQAAAYVLSAPRGGDEAGLIGAPETPPISAFGAAGQSQAAQLLEAAAHPDVRSIVPDPSKASGDITVDQVRALSSLFETTAAMGGWRVAIIDAADDLNRNAANALLKILEEPPNDSLFFLVSHAPGRLLPTIRSRCRQLKFKPPGDDEALEILKVQAPDAQLAEMQAALTLARSAPGEALAYLEADAARYMGQIDALLTGQSTGVSAQLAFANQMGDRLAGSPFEICLDILEARLHAGARSMLTGQPAALNDVLSFVEKIADMRSAVTGLNLSPKAAMLALLKDLPVLAAQPGE